MADGNVTPTTAASFIPEMWRDAILDYAERKFVLRNQVSDFSSMLAEGGDILNIPKVAEDTAAKIAMQQAEQKAKEAAEAEEKSVEEAEVKAAEEAKQEEQKTVVTSVMTGAEKLISDVEDRVLNKHEDLETVIKSLESEYGKGHIESTIKKYSQADKEIYSKTMQEMEERYNYLIKGEM